MLQLLQNHFVSHHTDLKGSSIILFGFKSFLVALQLLDSSDRTRSGQIFESIFYFLLFSYVLEAQSNKANKTLQAQT